MFFVITGTVVNDVTLVAGESKKTDY